MPEPPVSLVVEDCPDNPDRCHHFNGEYAPGKPLVYKCLYCGVEFVAYQGPDILQN